MSNTSLERYIELKSVIKQATNELNSIQQEAIQQAKDLADVLGGTFQLENSTITFVSKYEPDLDSVDDAVYHKLVAELEQAEAKVKALRNSVSHRVKHLLSNNMIQEKETPTEKIIVKIHD